MKNTLETRLGIFFALAILASAIVLEMIGSLQFLSGGLVIQAHFNNVMDLRVGDPVKMAGKQIGRVEDIRFDKNKLLVMMKIVDHTAVIRTDSRATIKFAGLMGQNYVGVDFGTDKGAPVMAGAELVSYEQADLGALLSKLDEVAGGIKKITDNVGDVNFGDLVSLVTDFVRENRPRIAGILTNTESISAQIASGQGTVGKLIYQETLYDSALGTVTNLNDATADIKSAVNQAKGIVADIRAGKGTLGKLTQDEKLYTETSEAMTNLKEILQKVNRGEGSVGKLVNDPSLVNNAKLTLQKLDKATDGLEDQGPLSILGIMAGKLF